MKKFTAFLCSLFVVLGVLYAVVYNEQSYIDKEYFDSAGNILDSRKYKSMSLQSEALKQKDIVMIYGSSELTKLHNPFRPIELFANKRDGFQIDSIGQAGYKCIIHAINFGALADRLKGHKVVFVISPQWFDKNGTELSTFHSSYSEDMFYAFMFNPKLDSSLKRQLAKRVLKITACPTQSDVNSGNKVLIRPATDNIKKLGLYYKFLHHKKKGLKNLILTPKKNSDNDDINLVRLYCKLSLGKSILDKAEFNSLRPYFYMRYRLLNIKSTINTASFLKEVKPLQPDTQKHIIPQKHTFNWPKLLKAAERRGDKYASHNRFGMSDDIYNRNLKGNLKHFKGIYKELSYTDSPEYQDFKLLLDICKSNGIKPLFVNVPVNGKWYDYCGFSKKKRAEYYSKINNLVKSYGFKIADFSGHEYDKYFLKDNSHLGYKGWVYVNEAIDKYYHNQL